MIEKLFVKSIIYINRKSKAKLILKNIAINEVFINMR